MIAAYMNYDAPKSENFNTPSINYVNAVLMSAGASHLELGDTGMLSSEYYPGNSMQITGDWQRISGEAMILWWPMRIFCGERVLRR